MFGVRDQLRVVNVSSYFLLTSKPYVAGLVVVEIQITSSAVALGSRKDLPSFVTTAELSV